MHFKKNNNNNNCLVVTFTYYHMTTLKRLSGLCARTLRLPALCHEMLPREQNRTKVMQTFSVNIFTVFVNAIQVNGRKSSNISPSSQRHVTYWAHWQLDFTPYIEPCDKITLNLAGVLLMTRGCALSTPQQWEMFVLLNELMCFCSGQAVYEWTPDEKHEHEWSSRC